MQTGSTTGWITAGLLFLAGAICLLAPEAFARRAVELTLAPAVNVPLSRAFGLALVAAGIALLTDRARVAPGRKALGCIAVAACLVLCLLSLSLRLSDWWIDDAGITFAYSRSLAEGLGLVAQPWLPPEEGYSSSAWMLLLALAGRLGADIPLAAKTLGLGFAVAALLAAAWIVARETRSPLAVLVCGTGIAVTPMVVWAASGQEHALQALLLMGPVLAAHATPGWRWPAALILALLVLTRPEAPIIVIAVFLAAVWLTRRAGGPLVNAADAAIALVPLAAFVALIGFRVAYFGDPFPNPYYAKATKAGLSGLLNPLSGGWFYTLWGLRDTGLFLLLPLLFLIRARRLPDWMVVAWAVLAGQAFFVVWAKGDWMAQYRFLMPVLPVLMLLAATGLRGLAARARRVFAVLAVLVLGHLTLVQTAIFGASPTTPLAAVTTVGDTFRTVADRLGIADPVLAHHDAGGIAYHRMIRLVDLGGLINRTIAQNMDDRAFLTAYLVDEVRPDFVFGGANFAAASGFAETEAFARAYVPLAFPDRPEMTTHLSHIRRDRAAEAPGITLVRDTDGTLLSVRALLGP